MANSDSDILFLDLEPSPRQQGVLRTLEASQRIALSKRGSPFHWEVRITNEAHGKVTTSTTSKPEPGSLFLINIKILQTEPNRRIKNASIEFTFRNKSAPQNDSAHPDIVKIALADKV